MDEQGVPIGLVSESDLLLKERQRELGSKHNLVHPLKGRHDRAKADAVVASELMSSPPITIASDASLSQAARLMHERNVRRLVVVDERGTIAGVVSRSDLLQVFLRSDEHDAIVVDVRWNVVTLSGDVDRKSDAEILTLDPRARRCGERGCSAQLSMGRHSGCSCICTLERVQHHLTRLISPPKLNPTAR